MLIFDSFPDRASAAAFAASVAQSLGVDACVFVDVDAAQRHDPIPVELTPPIVHVARPMTTAGERAAIDAVDGYGGTFQGT